MPLSTRAIALGILPRVHTTKPKQKKTHKHEEINKNKGKNKRTVESELEDSDEVSKQPVKECGKRGKCGKTKRLHVERPLEDEMDSVKVGVEPAKVEVVDVDAVEPNEDEVSIIPDFRVY